MMIEVRKGDSVVIIRADCSIELAIPPPNEEGNPTESTKIAAGLAFAMSNTQLRELIEEHAERCLAEDALETPEQALVRLKKDGGAVH